MYLNHVSLIGFLGKDPEQRKTRSNGNNNFLVLSVATMEWWKDANDERQSKTEWHRIVVFNRLAEVLGNILKKGDHVLVEGSLVSTRYERKPDEEKKARKGKADKPAKGVTMTVWNIRATTVRKLNRSEQTPEVAPAAAASGDLTGADDPAF